MEHSENKFVQYYIEQSLTDAALQRSNSIMEKILGIRSTLRLPTASLMVGDIGCNAGTQSTIWAENGHFVQGVDIVTELVDVARQRAMARSLDIKFDVASATSLPWASESMDVCILPELLEHVADWETCLAEAIRVLKPNGSLYLSTTNVLCPKQQEFDLPLYSWYPSWIKRKLEKLSVTTKRHWVSYTEYPAVHWFSYYQLRKHLRALGLESMDRFEMIANSGEQGRHVTVARLIASNPLSRFLGQVFTSYTVLVATRTR